MYYGYSYMLEESLLPALVPGLLGSIPSFIVTIFTYVFSSLSLYTIACRRELKNPWLSWIPIANLWILGSVSDQYRYIVKGENRAKRKILLGLQILMAVLGMVFMGLVIGITVKLVSGAMLGGSMEQLLSGMLGTFTGSLSLLIPWLGVKITFAVIRYMALYDLYASCDPEEKTLYLVLSILIGITEPIFLFMCRNKDQGMPPRKAAPQPQQTYVYESEY